ncbi:MAG: hypothetical protein HUK26_05095, partial [Duodenibacillus sp.]|nr:hypothetical protein [Duodenibacillus sp.]
IDHGKLKTENAALHAIKNLFATGKTLQQRNQALRGKMADILRDTRVPDLTDKFQKSVSGADHGKHLLADGARQEIIQGIKAAKQEIRTNFVMPAVLEQAQALPEDCRELACRLVKTAVLNSPTPDDLAATKSMASTLMQDIIADKGFQEKLALGRMDEYAMGENFTRAMDRIGPGLLSDMTSTWQGKGGHFLMHMHDGFILDAERGFVTTINGEPCPKTRDGAQQKLLDLMPDTLGVVSGPSNPGYLLRGMVSMLASQSGFPAQLCNTRFPKGQEALSQQLADAGLVTTYTGAVSSITVGEDKAIIETTIPIKFGAAEIRINGKVYDFETGNKPTFFSGYTIKMTVEVPLHQDLKRGDYPIFGAHWDRGPALEGLEDPL